MLYTYLSGPNTIVTFIPNTDQHVFASKNEALRVVLYENRVCNGSVTLPQFFFPAEQIQRRLRRRSKSAPPVDFFRPPVEFSLSRNAAQDTLNPRP